HPEQASEPPDIPQIPPDCQEPAGAKEVDSSRHRPPAPRSKAQARLCLALALVSWHARAVRPTARETPDVGRKAAGAFERALHTSWQTIGRQNVGIVLPGSRRNWRNEYQGRNRTNAINIGGDGSYFDPGAPPANLTWAHQ